MFCLKNPKACPILAATEPGSPCPKNIAPDADLRTDIPKYYIWRNGVKTEESDEEVTKEWADQHLEIGIS